MKSWNKLCFFIIIFCIIMFIVSNLYIGIALPKEHSREYQIELNRLHHLITQGVSKDTTEEELSNHLSSIELKPYKTLQSISWLSSDHTTEEAELFYKSNTYNYRIYPISNTHRVLSYIRIDYDANTSNSNKEIILMVNGLLVLFSLVLFLMIRYLSKEIIIPFYKMNDLPYALAKGTISKGSFTNGLKESHGRYFGKFLWGLDLLRENLENQKGKRLTLEKEKKLMILSISHDIKTPLSAIKLYAKALSSNLYEEEEKKQEIAYKIEEKSDEIEYFISEIVKQTKTDFLSIEIHMGEFYLKDFIDHVYSYYSEKLSLIKMVLIIDKFTNCLLKGDPDRLFEAFTNAIENGIKYGDGKAISITFGIEEDCQLINITNKGNTLPENEILTIFESFYRGSNTLDKPCSGLGLYIGKQIMNKMNGELYANIVEDQFSITYVIPRV